jgi:MFS family permease
VQRSYVLLVICVLAGLASAANALTVNDPFTWRLIALCVLMGLASTVYSIAVAITNDMMDSSQIIAASSGLLLSYGLGSVLGPLVSSALMERFGPEALFHTLAVALVSMAVFTLYRQYRVPPMPVDAQEHFIPAIPDVHVISEIDPRNEEFVDTPIEELFREEPTSPEVESGDEGELMAKPEPPVAESESTEPTEAEGPHPQTNEDSPRNGN